MGSFKLRSLLKLPINSEFKKVPECLVLRIEKLGNFICAGYSDGSIMIYDLSTSKVTNSLRFKKTEEEEYSKAAVCSLR